MNPQNTVFYFPVKAPEGSIQRNDLTAIETLEMWNALQEHWCEHKPSVTINVREDEWMEVGAWMFKHFDTVSGVSFLPYDGGTYRQAPYTEIHEDEYNKWVEKMPEGIDWMQLQEFEKGRHYNRIARAGLHGWWMRDLRRTNDEFNDWTDRVTLVESNTPGTVIDSNSL
jgi:hypothetical protein